MVSSELPLEAEIRERFFLKLRYCDFRGVRRYLFDSNFVIEFRVSMITLS